CNFCSKHLLTLFRPTASQLSRHPDPSSVIIETLMTNLTELAIQGTEPESIATPREDNKLRIEDHAAHDWYRFVLSYPAHLVRTYIDRFALNSGKTVLDPFCGTGTTLVECKKHGIPTQ